MMNKLSIILLAGVVAILGACSYSDKGIHYVDPIPGDPPLINVSTSLDTLISIEVTDSLEISYGVDIENGDFYQFEAYALNALIYFSDSIEDSFWIVRDTLDEPGVDTLYMFFYYSTNTNSLADIVELEFNVIELDFPINYEEGGTP